MSTPAPLHPEIVYAQRSSESEPEKNILYVTFNVPDIQGEPKLDIKEKQLTFSCTSGNPDKGVPVKEWACDLELWGEIIPSETKKNLNSRALVLVLRKKELEKEYWPRLTKEKVRNWIKTDFSKWVDEDEQDGEQPEMPDMAGMGDMMGGGMPGMGGMGGMPGMGGMGGMPGLGGMGGMPGMGGDGMGGMDFAKMMEQMGGMGAMGGAGGMPDFGGEDDDDLEDVEEGDKPKAASSSKDEPEVEEVE